MGIGLKIVCPAGESVGMTARGGACRCRIEHETITEQEAPSSLHGYCAGRYMECPTWRADKKRIAEGGPPLVDEHRYRDVSRRR